MPYSIKTKDGITVDGIPDDLPKDDQSLKDLVAQLRASGKKAGSFGGSQAPAADPGAPAASESGAIPQEPQAPKQGFLQSLVPTAEDLGAVARGVVGGVVSPVTMIADPITHLINLIPGANQLPPSEGLQLLLTRIGVPEPQTEAQKLLQAATSGMAGGGTQVMAGKALQLGKGLMKGVGEALAAQPVQQMAGGAAAGMASEGARAAGAPAPLQLAAGVAGGALGSRVGAPKMSAAMTDAAAQQEFGDLARKAAAGNGSAKKALAEAAAINPEAKAAAERLGIELPVDVFSDNAQVRAAAGLGRSVVGSPAEAQWRDTVKAAVDRADQLIQDAGATFSDGSAAPDVTSIKVRDSMLAARSELSKKASDIYREVDAAVSKSSPASTTKLSDTLKEIVTEVGEDGLTVQEKRLRDMANDSSTTYGRLMREKNLIGQALAKKDSPYGNMEAGALKRLYGALAEDQLSTVETLGDASLREKLSQANLIYGKERELGKQIVGAFGKDISGSIANKMRAAITSAAKGDSGAYVRLMDSVPQDLRKDVVATALASVARSGRGAEAGGFGFSEFAKTYQGIRRTPEVYKSVRETLGPESDALMRDLYEVSKRITDARANVLQTGKANQAFLRGENFFQRLMGSAVGGNVTRMAGTAAGGAMAGPLGAAVGSGLTSSFLESIAQSGAKSATAMGNLFKDPKFQGLMVKLSTGVRVGSEEATTLAKSASFGDFAKSMGLPSGADQRAAWLLSILEASQPAQQADQYGSTNYGGAPGAPGTERKYLGGSY
jgi:hypothetical protein